MTGFVGEHRNVYEVEPIWRSLRRRTTATRPERPIRRRARAAGGGIVRWKRKCAVFGTRTAKSMVSARLWKQLLREGWQVARCTVERLMHRLGLRGVIRDKGGGRPGTAVPVGPGKPAAPCQPAQCAVGQ